MISGKIFAFIDGDNTLIKVNDELIVKADTISGIRLNGKEINIIASKRDNYIKFKEAKEAKEVFKDLWDLIIKEIPRYRRNEKEMKK